MDTATIIMALLMGFTGSLHCAGMCGPIVWVMPFQVFNGASRACAITLYHVGRISVYALMGVTLHSFRHLFQPAIQQYISVITGGAMLLIGILSFFSDRVHIRMPWDAFIRKHLGNFIGKPRMGSILAAGILNGLLPCGLVYMALSASMMLTSAGQAAGMLYLFGLGTLPMLVSLTLLKTRIKLLPMAHFRKFVPLVVFFFGGLFVLRGLNLGIPYISPKVELAQGKIIHSCCHKK